MIEALLTPKVQKFIRDHENDDPATLMLRAKQFADIHLKEAVEQIQSRKKAKAKLPTWYLATDLIYPPPLSLEQSSSSITAEYKASLFTGEKFVDLTGGMGIDFSFLSKSFKTGFYIERQANLVEIARHNMKCLGLKSVEFHHTEAEDFLHQTSEKFDLIFLDPARRGNHDQKVFRIEDCEPNVISMLPLMKAKGRSILMKTSPLLDIKGAVKDLGGATQVHVVAVNNEVKELLFIIDAKANENPIIKAIDLTNTEVHFEFDYSQEQNISLTHGCIENYLYEPNVAILKAGAFKSIATQFGLIKLHVNSHLYTSKMPIAKFPGRSFKVIGEISLNKKELRKTLPKMKANITVRNYPMTVEQIRKKTGLTDGGDQYIFATTDQGGKKVVLCEKVDQQ
ncbi:THUMP-like domain-containing protein [Roseivirga sp.]|uniref:THUMP-like domain-containing protein n=1 Tax=Roseivirga sp. TaxID=1964215 RepID=UPI002B277893|nr:methyltransferase domain-containing protein [Roseivirga sp.]